MSRDHLWKRCSISLAAPYRRQAGNALAAGYGNLVCLWDLETGTTVDTFSDHDGSVTRIALSADDKYLASTGKKIILRSLEAPEMAVTISSTGHLAFSRDGKSLAVVGSTVRWWGTDILGLNLASYWAGNQGQTQARASSPTSTCHLTATLGRWRQMSSRPRHRRGSFGASRPRAGAEAKIGPSKSPACFSGPLKKNCGILGDSAK